MALENEHTTTHDTVTSAQITAPGAISAAGLGIVVAIYQRNLAYVISSTSGDTWTVVRDGSVGGIIGGQFTYVYSTPTSSGTPNFTTTWPVGGAAGNVVLKYFAIPGVTTVHDGDEDTETQTEGAVAVTLTSDLIDEGFDTTGGEVIVSVGRETPVAGAADQGFNDFMHTYDARFTEGGGLVTLVSAAQGRAEHIQLMHDLGATSAVAESVSGTTNNVAGTAEVRYASIRLLFDRVARSAGRWHWNGEPGWQVVRGM